MWILMENLGSFPQVHITDKLGLGIYKFVSSGYIVIILGSQPAYLGNAGVLKLLQCDAN